MWEGLESGLGPAKILHSAVQMVHTGLTPTQVGVFNVSVVLSRRWTTIALYSLQSFGRSRFDEIWREYNERFIWFNS